MSKLINKVKINIASLFRKKVIIPSYEEKRAVIDFYRKKFNAAVMVETGTFLGDTVEFFKTKFDKIYSIELSEELAAKATKRFENDHHVKILQGDSGNVLKSLLSNINQPALFWLDGHYSSEFFIGDEYIKTGKGEKDTPVEEELDAVFTSSSRHCVLIDDARLFVGQSDYPTLRAIERKANAFNYQFSVERDIIIITPTL